MFGRFSLGLRSHLVAKEPRIALGHHCRSMTSTSIFFNGRSKNSSRRLMVDNHRHHSCNKHNNRRGLNVQKKRFVTTWLKERIPEKEVTKWSKRIEGFEKKCLVLRNLIGGGTIAYLVHVANVATLIAAHAEDMLELRIFMITASVANVVFNLLQSPVRWSPALWSFFFFLFHGERAYDILNERKSIELSDNELELYRKAFLPHSFRPVTMKMLLKQGEGRFETFEPGEVIIEQGEEMMCTSFLLEGTIKIVKDGKLMCRLHAPGDDYDGEEEDEEDDEEEEEGKGTGTGEEQQGGEVEDDIMKRKIASMRKKKKFFGWIGTPWDPHRDYENPPHWEVTAESETPIRIVRFHNIEGFGKCIGNDPVRRRNAERMMIEDLSVKVERIHSTATEHLAKKKEKVRRLKEKLEAQRFHGYLALVQLVIADGEVSDVEIAETAAYRARYGITDEQHEEALARAGWKGLWEEGAEHDETHDTHFMVQSWGKDEVLQRRQTERVEEQQNRAGKDGNENVIKQPEVGEEVALVVEEQEREQEQGSVKNL